MIRMLCSALAVSFLFAGVMHGQDSKIPVPITTKDQKNRSADFFDWDLLGLARSIQ
jgi:hypothetical protein